MSADLQRQLVDQYFAAGHGAKNKILGAVAEALPDTAAAQAHRGLSEPGSARR